MSYPLPRLVSANHPGVEDVLMYLEEKLSPGQIGLFARHSGHTFRGVNTHALRANRKFWFRLENVPEEYWAQVVHPGLKYMAKRLGKLIIFSPERTNYDIIEFCFW